MLIPEGYFIVSSPLMNQHHSENKDKETTPFWPETNKITMEIRVWFVYREIYIRRIKSIVTSHGAYLVKHWPCIMWSSYTTLPSYF